MFFLAFSDAPVTGLANRLADAVVWRRVMSKCENLPYMANLTLSQSPSVV
jgi:hypothetical protein